MKTAIFTVPRTPAAAVDIAAAANATAEVRCVDAVAVKADASARLENAGLVLPMLWGTAPARFDAAQVSRIPDAFDIAAFKINPEAIADRLIANARELLAQVRR